MSDLPSENKIPETVSPSTLHALMEALTDTEKSLLTFLDNYHYAYGSHIQRLFFTHGTTAAMTRARNRLLTKLTNELLVYRYPRKPLRGNRHGSTEHIYTLAHAGQSLMNELRFNERPYRSIERTTSHYEHALAVTELYVQLQEEDRASRVKLVTALGEPSCHRHFGLSKILKPDAYFLFRISVKGRWYEVGWFIEMERSRQGEPSTLAKIRTYVEYMEHLNPDKEFMPKVLFITFTERHNAHLIQLLNRNTGADRDVFASTLFSNAIPTMIRGAN